MRKLNITIEIWQKGNLYLAIAPELEMAERIIGVCQDLLRRVTKRAGRHRSIGEWHAVGQRTD